MLRLVILKKAQMLLRVFGKCLTRLSVSKQTNNYDGRVVVRRTDRYSTGALPSNPQHTIISDTMLPNSYQHIIFQSFLCYPGHELIFSTTDFRIYNCHTKLCFANKMMNLTFFIGMLLELKLKTRLYALGFQIANDCKTLIIFRIKQIFNS